MNDAATPPHQIEQSGPFCDVLSTFDYLVPGYFLLTTNSCRTGAAERAGTDRPNEEPIFSSFTAQAVTPLAGKTTRYFFCFGPWSKAEDGEQQKVAYRDLGYRAFKEDRDILTAQQRIIDADPLRKMTLFDVDKVPVLYRRIVDRLLAAESTD
jgi:hypothetical protein